MSEDLQKVDLLPVVFRLNSIILRSKDLLTAILFHKINIDIHSGLASKQFHK